jgi:16S rRNA U516 pseudouridylate synthase RsuA-like enzyme
MSEINETLGQTGDTVVYSSPKGLAYKSRDTVDAAVDSNWSVSEQPTLLEAEPVDPEKLIQDLLKQGRLTESQVQVGRYDHETTGLSLLEAMAARGWLPPECLDDCWE